MCVLQAGQIVEVAAPDTCCFRLHSKHSIIALRCRFQKSSNLPRKEGLCDAGASSFERSFRPGFGANGENERAHLRQIELFAAAYSVFFKPHSRHSSLTFTSDGFAPGL